MRSLSFHKLGCFLSLLIATGSTFAQAPDVSVIDSLRVPTSPAFKIIGTEPTSVERPTDLKTLALDLGSIVNTGGGLPQQFAIEFGLSKLFSSGKKGLFDYYYPSIPSAAFDNLSISLASAEIPADMFVDTSFHASTSWSFGIRTHILSGSYSIDRAAFKKMINDSISIKDNVDRVLKYVLITMVSDTSILPTLKTAIANGSFSGVSIPTNITFLFDNAFGRTLTTTPGLSAQLTTNDLKQLRASVLQFFVDFVRSNSSLFTNLTSSGNTTFIPTYEDWSTTNILNSPSAIYSAQRLAQMLSVKSGHFLEIAAAGAGVGRDDKVDKFSLKRYGIWLSYSYRPSSSTDWEGAAMLRFISNQADSTQKIASYDIGCRVSCPRLWQAALSFETIARFSPEAIPDYRIAVIGEYPISSSFYLTATFGRGFDLETTGEGNLLSVLGIKFGLGASRLVIGEGDLE